MISQEALPSGLITRRLDVLRTLSSSERDLIRIVVEVVHELRDANDDESRRKLYASWMWNAWAVTTGSTFSRRTFSFVEMQ
ncbi:hypothetical protein BC826DRAFT_1061292 [Russula brevipes]|nr:hypothetical protein BC826DRAFT_1061292 [Russula brevipes]